MYRLLHPLRRVAPQAVHRLIAWQGSCRRGSPGPPYSGVLRKADIATVTTWPALAGSPTSAARIQDAA